MTLHISIVMHCGELCYFIMVIFFFFSPHIRRINVWYDMMKGISYIWLTLPQRLKLTDELKKNVPGMWLCMQSPKYLCMYVYIHGITLTAGIYVLYDYISVYGSMK